jgi:iron complex transport system substrate-binding protein
MGRLAQLLVALALVVTACGAEGSGTKPEPQAQQGEFPVTIEAASGTVEIDSQPQRVVSISPTATEMLYAIDAGDQVVAVDDQSNYPKDAPMTDLSGFEPNVEAIAGYEPDLVIASSAAGIARALKSLKIPLLVQEAAVTIDDSYAQIEELGTATGHETEAEDVVAEMETEIESITSSLPTFEDPPTYYHELDDTYFSVTSDTFIGNVYGLLGLENIADKADKAGSGYPQLNAEYIIDADPDLIFLADTKCCGQSASTVAKRPGWDQIAAVENGDVVELDDDIASRWGPRVVDLLRIVGDAVEGLEGGDA